MEKNKLMKLECVQVGRIVRPINRPELWKVIRRTGGLTWICILFTMTPGCKFGQIRSMTGDEFVHEYESDQDPLKGWQAASAIQEQYIRWVRDIDQLLAERNPEWWVSRVES